MIPDRFIPTPGGADALVAGCYLIKRTGADRVDIPVRIWFGPPVDADGVEMDRSPRWQVLIAGVPFDDEPLFIGNITFDHISGFWPSCANMPIDQAEYDFRIERQDWAAIWDQDDPMGRPGSKIDPMTASLPFGD